MKKRLVSTIIISAMVLAMTGCGKTTEAPADQGAAAQAGSEEAGQEKTYKIALLEKGAEDSSCPLIKDSWMPARSTE